MRGEEDRERELSELSKCANIEVKMLILRLRC